MLVVLENNEDMGLLDHEDLDHLFIEVSGSGYKAVSASLLWLILYVTSYPDIQTKVHVSRNRFYLLCIHQFSACPPACPPAHWIGNFTGVMLKFRFFLKYSKTCLKRPLKKKTRNWFQDR